MPVTIADGDIAPAQAAGVRIGTRRDAPVSLRVFRPQATRIAVLAGAIPAQLLAMRAAAAGAVIRVWSPRPQAWGPVVRHGVDVSVAPAGAGFPPPGSPHQPVLIVDDRPTDVGGLGDAGPWQCRLDIRAVASPADLGFVGHADVLVLGQVSAAIATALAGVMGLTTSMIRPISGLGPSGIALVARGSIQYVTLDPSQSEAQLLAQSAR